MTLTPTTPAEWTGEVDRCEPCCPITAAVEAWYSYTDYNGDYVPFAAESDAGAATTYNTGDPDSQEGKARVQMRLTAGSSHGALLQVRARVVHITYIGDGERSYSFGAEVTFAQAVIDGPFLVGADDYYQIPQPSSENVESFLTGPAGRIGELRIYTRRASLAKKGWPGWIGAGAVPIIYKKQTAFGLREACDESDTPALSYSGADEYSEGEAETNLPLDPAGTRTITYSDDMAESGLAAPGLDGDKLPATFGAVEDEAAGDLSWQSRYMHRTFTCGDVTKGEFLLLTLSDPYPTSDLQGAVQNALDEQVANDASFAGEIVATHRLTPDEVYLSRAGSTVNVASGGDGVDSANAFADDGANIELTVRYKKRVTTFATGEQVVSDATANLTITVNDSSTKFIFGLHTDFAEAFVEEVTAEMGTQVEIFDVTADPVEQMRSDFFLELLPED